MGELVQRVAAIHDLSGYGKASLTIVIPTLSTMGIQVCPLPTAVLSTHTGFPDFTLHDLTAEMGRILAHWKALALEFDAIYSGFLGSPEQIAIVQACIRDFRRDEQIVLVDPVMGDDGSLYASMDSAIVDGMRRLIADADIITPNCTEAALLVGAPYDAQVPIATVKAWAAELSSRGPARVIVTSVPTDETQSASVIGFDRATGQYWRVRNAHVPVQYPGTGDAFASTLLGYLLRGESFPAAMDRAVQFVALAIRASFGFDHPRRDGIAIERVLGSVLQPVST